jgi:plasmid stabilization system protein ParE
MDCQIQISAEALAEFQEIIEYSWLNFPGSSEQFGNDLLDHLEILRTFPYLGRRLPHRPEIRELVHTPILIYYLVRRNPDVVQILHFWNALRGEFQF